MEFTEEVLILDSRRFRERDLRLKILSPTRGALTAFAFGGSVSRRRFGGCLDPLDITRLSLGRSRSGDYLQAREGSLTKRFHALRTDWPRLGMAVNCVKFTEAVLVGPEGGPSFDLLTQTLALLDGMRQEPKAIPLYFRARLTFEHGFSPMLDACLQCGVEIDKLSSLSFDIDSGHVICRDCRQSAQTGSGLVVPAGKGALKTLARIQRAPVGEWATLSMPATVRGECYEIVDTYIRRHLGLEWDRTRYRRI